MKIRPKRVLTWVGKGLAALLGIVIVIVAIALITLQTPWAQHKIARIIGEQADTSVKGRVEVAVDGSLSLFGFRGIVVRILPADVNDHRTIAELSNVQASWDLKSLVQSLLGSGPLYVGINHVEVERAFVDLRSDPDGTVALVNATTPEPSNEPETPSSGPSPYVHLQGLDIYDVHIVLPAQTAATQGAVTSAPREATIEQIHADFDMQDVMSGTVTLTSLAAAIPGQSSVFIGNLGAAFYLNEQSVPVAKVTLEGNLEGLPLRLDGIYDDKNWAAHVEADGSSEVWQGTALGFEPTQDVSVAAFALGDLTSAEVNAAVGAGSSAIETLVKVGFSPLVASGDLVVRQANPHAFASAAPIGSLNVTAGFSAQSEPQSANVRLTLRDSSLEAKPIPDFDLSAMATGSTHAEFRLKATDDSGLELAGKVDNLPDGVNFAVQGQAQRLPDYPGAPQLSAFDVQDLELDGHGTWRSQTQSLDASLQLALARLDIASANVAVADLSVHVTTKGKLTAPALEGEITARALRFGEIQATGLRVLADDLGNGESELSAAARVRLKNDAPVRQLTARTTITALSPLTAKSTELTIEGDKHRLATSIRSVRVGDDVAIEGIRVSGVGELTGRFGSKGKTLDANAQIESLDLGALSQLFTPLVPPLKGTLSADIALEAVGQRLSTAHVFARATGVGTNDVRADALGASLVVKQDELSGVVTVQRGQSHVRVDARDVDLYKLRRTTQAGFRAEDFRGYVVATVLAHSRDFSEFERGQGELHVEGLLQAQIMVEQRDDLPLRFNSAVKLRDVDVRKAEPRVPTDWLNGTDAAIDQDTPARADKVAKSDEDLARSASEWAITGLNAEWVSKYDGATGQWLNTVGASDRNRPVELATIALKTKVPLARLNDELGAWIPNAAIEGSVVMPAVTLDSLPGGSFIPSGIEASIEADIRLHGTVASPQAEGSLYIRDFQVSTSNDSFPVTVALDAKASKEAVSADFKITHEALLLVSGSLEGAPQQADWRVNAKIDELPLGSMPFVRDYGVTGRLSGDLALETGANSPSIVATLEALDVEAYGEKIPSTRIDARLANGQGKVVADIRQASGFAQLTAVATSPSGQLADYRPKSARLQTRAFQIRPFLVALQGAVSDLAGVLDGTVDVTFTEGSTDATGELKLREGLVLMPALGKQVHDLELTVRALPGRLELSRLSAKVERGIVGGTGSLKYTPDGRMLAQVDLRLPDNKRLPIANKGRDVAEASGRIKVVASSGPNEETKLSVDVPVLDVYFSDSATDKVMSSDSPAFVSLGTYLPDGHFVTYSSTRDNDKKEAATSAKPTPASKPMLLTVNLGKKVWLHHGTSTFAAINGKIEASLGAETRLTGMLNLAEGRIDIQGRVFDIRPGTVTFRGDSPPNPDVVAEAAWNAPSGYTIIATYRGSVSNGKVVLRSEPPLSYGEILNVLLFDDPEGSGGSDGSPGAGEVAATIASAGLSRSLTSLTDMDIQANIETDAAGSPRPELGVRLSPRLAVEVAYNLEPSAALSQPPDKAFVSFDWRLSNSWTFEATLGDHGSAATDLTWKYRY